MILPLYIFTIIFVAGPLLYMVALSFAQPKAGHGVEWAFTLANYKKILDPVYMKTFTGSFQLAVTSTIIICLIGYPALELPVLPHSILMFLSFLQKKRRA